MKCQSKKSHLFSVCPNLLCHSTYNEFKMLSLKCAILMFSIVFLSVSAEFSTKFWGEELTPRLKVNYLSQSNGKNLIFFVYCILKPWFLCTFVWFSYHFLHEVVKQKENEIGSILYQIWIKYASLNICINRNNLIKSVLRFHENQLDKKITLDLAGG